jgi:hypothetical protein
VVQYATFGAVVEDTNQAREDFFRLLFGNNEGYICIAYLEANRGKRDLHEHWFKYPEELPKLLDNILTNSKTLAEAYFCPQLFGQPGKRKKEYVSLATNAWADLDECDPALMNIEPTVVTQTSAGHFQAYWLFDKAQAPSEAESVSRRIAYFHASQGADRSGWDLTQLLRIPYTANYKYGDINTAPIVAIITANQKLYRVSDFGVYPEIPAVEFASESTPDLLAEKPIDILQRYRRKLNPQAFELFQDTPDEGVWSEKLWKLIQFCVEAGLSRPETLTVVHSAGCNKYARDSRPISDLWNEVCRGYIKHLEITNQIPTPDTVLPSLLTNEERRVAQSRETVIERYIDWAKQITDASPQYHQAGAFTLLGALVAANCKLQTSFGDVVPNLWFAVLGETTITRKSTAMKIALSILREIDEDVMFATDGTSEGILSGLAGRDGKPSLFFRDEITGLFQSILTKDYMSDMPETLTKLYDGDMVRRLLRKEEIIVKDSCFLILCGGIKEKVQSMLSEEHIASGFIPRFIFITATPDISQIRPIGPKTSGVDEWRETLKNELTDLYHHYADPREVTHGRRFIGTEKPEFDVTLTNDAWQRYNEFELLMISTALDTGLSYLTPVYDRLAKSTLKAAILIAASRQRNMNVVVDVDDLLHAIYYCEQWRGYANDVINSVGKSESERLMETMLQEIRLSPRGVTRHELMSKYRLSKKDANDYFETMQQRQWIEGIPVGRDMRYSAI